MKFRTSDRLPLRVREAVKVLEILLLDRRATEHTVFLTRNEEALVQQADSIVV